MKMYLMKCPHCGGQLDVEAGMESFFCKYCGTRIVVDKTELEIRRMEHEEKVNEHKERMKDKEIKSEKVHSFFETIMNALLIFMALAMITVAFILKLSK